MMGEPQGQIVTFYSFKGGTGRTMALANVAWILAANGKRVLVADWDLESPGLHRFFRPFLSPDLIEGTGGVIDMIRNYEWQATGGQTDRPEGYVVERPDQWFQENAKVARFAFSLRWSFPDGGTLDFLSAGRQNGDYAVALTGLNWENFYNRLDGGRFLDALRDDMKRNYDFTLIDSRTGLSDVADICTIHLPDSLVDCFTFSEQGIDGAAKVADSIQEKYLGRNIRIMPVPMRVDQAEKEKADAGRAVAMRRFTGLPAGMSDTERRLYWASVEVPYQAFYGYEETLATFGDVPGSPKSMLGAFEKLTEYITRGEVTSLPPMDESTRMREVEKFKRRAEITDEEILLRYAAEDEVWAEWIESLLIGAGVRVSDAQPEPGNPARYGPGVRTLAIVSSAEAGIHRVQPGGSEPLIVYVTDMRPLPNISMDRSSVVASLNAVNAAERILRLIGRPPADEPVVTGARFPGKDQDVFNAPARNPRFTGRDEALRSLRAQLRSRGTAVVLPVVALQGMGGVGKTQLALEYAHRYRDAYDVVWWIPADPPQFLDTYLSDLAVRLGLNVGSNAVENSHLVLNALSRGEPTDRWLLIYDNADDIEHVQTLLPKGRGHTLITSRNNAWGSQAHPLEVNVFQRKESITHLRRRLTTITEDEAKQVAEVLGDLPIAISATEAWLAETGAPVADYLQQIEVGPAGTASVQETWKLSLERLANQSAGAYRLLQLCSVLAAEIATELIYSDEMAEALVPFERAVADRSMRPTLVQHLNKLSLIKLDVPNGQIQVHRLLQRVVQERMSEQELAEARHQVHLVLAASRPRGEVEDPETWRRFRMLWPHLLISDAVGCDDEKVRQLLIDRVRYLWLRGDLTQGEQLGRRIAADWADLLDSDPESADESALHRQRLHLQFNLANILRSQARFQEAKALDEEVLAEQTELLGPRHAHTLMTSGGLAADLRGLGRYEEALEMDKTTYLAWKDILGESHPRSLSAANNLATSHRLMGDFRAARELDELVYGQRQVVSPGHLFTHASGSCLGRDYRDAGDYKKSVSLLQTVYDNICAARGADGTEASIAHANLAVSLRAAGRAVEAMPILDSAYKRLYGTLGGNHTDTLACRLSRAVNRLAMGENESADREMRAVINAYTEILGPKHPHTLVCMSSRSAILRALNDREMAGDLAQRAAASLAEILSLDHPFTIGAQMNQAICLAEQGDLEDARVLTVEALGRLSRTLGPDHPDTLRAEANLALILRAMGETGPAAQGDRVVARLAAVIEPQHPSVKALQQGIYAHRIIEPHPF